MAFPTVETPSPGRFSQVLVKAQTRIPFESGVVQSAAKHTVSRYMFRMGWTALPLTDWDLIETHFDTYQGSTFTYTHPVTATEYTVRYQGDALPEARYLTEEYVEVDGLVLEEA